MSSSPSTSSRFLSTLTTVKQLVSSHQFGTAVQVAVSELQAADELFRNTQAPEYAQEVRELELVVVFAVLANVQASLDSIEQQETTTTKTTTQTQNNTTQLQAAIEELSIADELSVTPIHFSPILEIQRTMLRLRYVKLLAWVRAAQGKHTSALISWNLAIAIASSIGMIQEIPSLHLNGAVSCLRLSSSRAKEALSHSHKAYLATVAILGTLRHQLKSTQEGEGEGGSEEEDVCVLALSIVTRDLFDSEAAEVRSSIAEFVTSIAEAAQQANGAGDTASSSTPHSSPSRSPMSSRVGSRIDTSVAATQQSPWYSPPADISEEEATDFNVEIQESDEAYILPMRFIEWAGSDRQNVPKRFPFLQFVIKVEEEIRESEGRSLQTQYIGQIRQWGGVLALCYRSTGRSLEAIKDDRSALVSYAAGCTTAKQCLGTPHYITSTCEAAYNAALSDGRRHTAIHSPPRITRQRTSLTKTKPVDKIEPAFRNVTLPQHKRRVMRPCWSAFFNSQACPLTIPDDVLLRYDDHNRSTSRSGRAASSASNIDDLDATSTTTINKSSSSLKKSTSTKGTVDTTSHQQREVVSPKISPGRKAGDKSDKALPPLQSPLQLPPLDIHTPTTPDTMMAASASYLGSPPPRPSSKLSAKAIKKMKEVYCMKYDAAHHDLHYVNERNDQSFHRRDNIKALEKQKKEDEKRYGKAAYRLEVLRIQEAESKEGPPLVVDDHAVVVEAMRY